MYLNGSVINNHSSSLKSVDDAFARQQTTAPESVGRPSRIACHTPPTLAPVQPMRPKPNIANFRPVGVEGAHSGLNTGTSMPMYPSTKTRRHITRAEATTGTASRNPYLGDDVSWELSIDLSSGTDSATEAFRAVSGVASNGLGAGSGSSEALRNVSGVGRSGESTGVAGEAIWLQVGARADSSASWKGGAMEETGTGSTGCTLSTSVLDLAV
mmetsp:Transcript_6478/g.14960  ORF Transcript_6478/g.14960 Transcript_6478/m.14960 type:complete len:213 (+) Transcript_6478:1-639(+)